MAEAAATAAEFFRAAAGLQGMRARASVAPDDAPTVAEAGRARFYDALAGRFGLPGRALDPAAAGARYDLTDMTAGEVVDLARRLVAEGRVDVEAGSLMGLEPGGLPYAGDPIFDRSPLSLFAEAFGQGRRGGTWDWIAQHTAQHRYLVEAGGDPRAIRGSEKVLDQLYRLQAEQALYATMDGDDDTRSRATAATAAGPFGGGFGTLSLPPQMLSVFAG